MTAEYYALIEYFCWQPTSNRTVFQVQNQGNIEHEKLKKIVEGCISNDRNAQRSLYEMFYGKMMGVCLRYANDPNQAKDILQDGFIKVFRNLERYNFSGSFEGWVRRIIVNTAIDYFRKSRSSHVLLLPDEQAIEEFEEISEEADFELEPTEEVEYDMQDIIAAMHQLSPSYRAVFNLYVMENKTHKEIADLLEISVGTSKSNFSKAKLNIRKILLRKENN